MSQFHLFHFASDVHDIWLMLVESIFQKKEQDDNKARKEVSKQLIEDVTDIVPCQRNEYLNNRNTEPKNKNKNKNIASLLRQSVYFCFASSIRHWNIRSVEKVRWLSTKTYKQEAPSKNVGPISGLIPSMCCIHHSKY